MRESDSAQFVIVVNSHFSGNPNRENRDGVGIIVNEQTARQLTNFIGISKRQTVTHTA